MIRWMEMDEFKPGDKVPRSGIYKVVHQGGHQDEHEVTAVKGDTLPLCKLCGDHPRFTLVTAAHHVQNHEHFKA
jgi:YjzC-like protein